MKNVTDYGFERSKEIYHRELRKCKPMTREEESQVWLDYKSTGSLEARNKLITSNLRLVADIAKSYEGRGLTYQELLAVGSDGLFNALNGYDETRGYRFTSYAVYWIRQAMQNALRKKGPLDAEELPTDHEEQLVDCSANEPFISSQPEPDKEEHARRQLQGLLKKLKPKERMVVENVHNVGGSGLSMPEMARELGMTEQRVNQILLSAMTKLRIFALSESALSKKRHF